MNDSRDANDGASVSMSANSKYIAWAERLRTAARPLVVLVVNTAFVTGAAFAHHSAAGRFDTASIMEVEGEITSVHWRSPHVEYTLDTADDTGARVVWTLEAAAPSTLARSGLGADTIEIGDRVRVAGWPPVTDKREMFLQNALLSTGEELLLWVTAQSRWSDEQENDFAFWRQTEGDSSQPELGIFRVWSSSLRLPGLFSLNPASVNDYPLTAVARAAVQEFAAAGENRSIQGCVPKGMPLMMEQPYPMEFLRVGDDIVLHMEEYDAMRTIHMDRDAAPAATENSPTGYSVGHWEGETLVVRTTHLNWPWFSQTGIPQSAEATLIERFTPAADGSRLTYELTASDPVNFNEPVTAGKQWLYLPDQEVRPYECATASAQ